MSNNEVPNLDKDENENIENKVKEETTKLKEKSKDKEKETSNLLEEDQNILNEAKNNNQRNINNNELIYFIILAIFVFIVSRLVQIKVPTPEQKYQLQSKTYFWMNLLFMELNQTKLLIVLKIDIEEISPNLL